MDRRDCRWRALLAMTTLALLTSPTGCASDPANDSPQDDAVISDDTPDDATDDAMDDVTGELDTVADVELDTTPDVPDVVVPPALADESRRVASMALAIDLTVLTGSATITLEDGLPEASGVTLEVGSLIVVSVTDDDIPLNFEVADSKLNIGLLPSDVASTFTVDYRFAPVDDFDGWMPEFGVTFTWPTFCGNLFPCRSNPDDGLATTLSVTGVPDGMMAIYPTSTPAEAPAYMLAIAVGPYEKLDLGETSAGTTVSAYYLRDDDAEDPTAAHDNAVAGTLHLRDAFEFLESTLGPYTYGDSVATVEANWGPGDFGGAEHHPFWHVHSGSFSQPTVHVHEAAHGWFGNGIRIACWEDFVLSEGVTQYLAGRALAAVGVDVWADFACGLDNECAFSAVTVLPDDTCNAIDILTDPIWSFSPYVKGAFFLREVALIVGDEVLDAALASFYAENVGQSARMGELIGELRELVEDPTAIDILHANWLDQPLCPEPSVDICPPDIE